MEDELDSSQTPDQLGVREGDSIFIRKIDGGEEKVDEIEEEQGEFPRMRSEVFEDICIRKLTKVDEELMLRG